MKTYLFVVKVMCLDGKHENVLYRYVDAHNIEEAKEVLTSKLNYIRTGWYIKSLFIKCN